MPRAFLIFIQAEALDFFSGGKKGWELSQKWERQEPGLQCLAIQTESGLLVIVPSSTSGYSPASFDAGAVFGKRR